MLATCCAGVLAALCLPTTPILLARADAPFVEFDCMPIPTEGKIDLVVKVYTEKAVLEFKTAGPNGDSPDGLAAALAASFKDAGATAKVVDKNRVRVYGAKVDGKFYPVTKGTVTSESLMADQLPKVKNPEKTG